MSPKMACSGSHSHVCYNAGNTITLNTLLDPYSLQEKINSLALRLQAS